MSLFVISAPSEEGKAAVTGELKRLVSSPASGGDIITDLDAAGALKLKGENPSAVLIFLVPLEVKNPSADEAEAYKRRHEHDYQVVVESPSAAAEEIAEIIGYHKGTK